MKGCSSSSSKRRATWSCSSLTGWIYLILDAHGPGAEVYARLQPVCWVNVGHVTLGRVSDISELGTPNMHDRHANTLHVCGDIWASPNPLLRTLPFGNPIISAAPDRYIQQKAKAKAKAPHRSHEPSKHPNAMHPRISPLLLSLGPLHDAAVAVPIRFVGRLAPIATIHTWSTLDATRSSSSSQ